MVDKLKDHFYRFQNLRDQSEELWQSHGPFWLKSHLGFFHICCRIRLLIINMCFVIVFGQLNDWLNGFFLSLYSISIVLSIVLFYSCLILRNSPQPPYFPIYYLSDLKLHTGTTSLAAGILVFRDLFVEHGSGFINIFNIVE